MQYQVLYEMSFLNYRLIFFVFITKCTAEVMYTTDFNFRAQPGSRTCFFEKAKASQVMEVYYQVLDGQHGDLDISLDIIDPTGNKIVSDYKRSENSIIMDLVLDGEYSVCLDNTFSVVNSKLVFIYVMIEDQQNETVSEADTEFNVLSGAGNEEKQVEALHWRGTDDTDEPYYIAVEYIADSMSRTLKHVVKARHMLDLFAASKSRDSYIASEDTFIVDLWSGIQISFMCITGFVQVYMIKKLFQRTKNYKTLL